MDYILDICPKCMDKLYEREKPLDDNGKKYNPVSAASCPTCGGIPVMKEEIPENSPSEVEVGIFCEKCNKWIHSFYTTK